MTVENHSRTLEERVSSLEALRKIEQERFSSLEASRKIEQELRENRETLFQRLTDHFMHIQTRDVTKTLARWTWHRVLADYDLPQFGTGKC